MVQDRLYGYLPSDFGPDLPTDPGTAAQTAASLMVTLSRSARALGLVLEGAALAAPLQVGARAFAAGDPVERQWTLIDQAKGTRLTAYRLPGQDRISEAVTLIATVLPLTPGQSYRLSLPGAQGAQAVPFAGGFVAGTRLLTEAGKRRIEDIVVGEKVWTDAGGFQPVLWHGVQHHPARGLAAPVRLRRGFLGLGEDLLIAGSQGVRIDTGGGPVLVPAAAFEAAGQAVRDFGPSHAWHQVLLPGHAVIFAHALPCESLWAPAVLAGGVPVDWPADYVPPEAPAHPRLSEADAVALLR